VAGVRQGFCLDGDGQAGGVGMRGRMDSLAIVAGRFGEAEGEVDRCGRGAWQELVPGGRV